MAVNSKSVAWVASLKPPQVVLDGGPAKSKSLDRDELDAFLAGRGPASEMDADWIATDRALHFLHYNSGRGHSWAWSDIDRAELVGGGMISSRVRIVLRHGDPAELTMGRRAARSLLAIVAKQTQNQRPD